MKTINSHTSQVGVDIKEHVRNENAEQNKKLDQILVNLVTLNAHPPPRLDDLDVMQRVQERFNAGRMNEILAEYGIERPRGITCTDKAKLLVNRVRAKSLSSCSTMRLFRALPRRSHSRAVLSAARAASRPWQSLGICARAARCLLQARPGAVPAVLLNSKRCHSRQVKARRSARTNMSRSGTERGPRSPWRQNWTMALRILTSLGPRDHY